MKINYLTHCIVGFALTGLSACGGGSSSGGGTHQVPNQAPSAVISVGNVEYASGDRISLTLDDTKTFSAKASSDPEDGSNLTYFWNDEEDESEIILTFSELGEQEINLYVKDSEGLASATFSLSVDVQDSEDEVLGIEIQGPSTVKEGLSIQLTAVVDYKKAADGNTVIWSVQEGGSGSASIDEQGVLSGISAGSVRVEATQGGITETKEVTITPAEIEKVAKSVEISGAQSVELEKSIQLSALVQYESADPDSEVSWRVENIDGEASISEAGILTANKVGKVSVLAQSLVDAQVLDTYEITITKVEENAVSSVEISGAKEVDVEKEITLSATVAYTLEDSDSEVEWSVENGTGEASITEAGVLTGEKEGSVTVVAKSKLDASVSAEHKVDVIDKITGLVIESIEITGPEEVEVDTSINLSAVITYAHTVGDNIDTWSVEDGTGSAVITQDGKLTGTKEGTVIVSAERLDEVATKTITVVAAAPEDINIYVKAPSAWTTSMHYWSSKTETTTWPGEALDAADEAGWHVKTFAPDALPSAGIIINNGAATGTIKTVDLTPPTTSGCYIVSDTADGIDGDGFAAHSAEWQEIGEAECDFGVPRLKISASPESKSFVAEFIEVTLSVDETLAEGAQAYYTLDGSDPASEANSARIAYGDGDKLTLGDTLELEESVTLKLFAAHSDSEGENASQSYTYTKTDVQSCTPDTDSGDFKFCVESDEDSYVVTVKYTGAGEVDLSSDKTQVLLNGEYLDASEGFDANSQSWSFSQTGLEPSKYSYTVRVENDSGAHARPLFVPMWIGEGMRFADFGWKDAIMYQVFNDRFLDGDPSNNLDNSQSPLNQVSDPLSQWQGGDFAGITKKIKDGYFTDMGITALWVSSPILNSHGIQPGVKSSDNQSYSSYHSYHPVATGYTHLNDYGYDKPIESAFGTAEEFKELVNEAHKRGIRIVPDFVANHVQSEAQMYIDHSAWFYNHLACDPGNWDNENRTSCWFTTKMPDFNFKDNPDAIKAVVDHALWIVQEFNIDGFRNDALKHMDDEFVRALKAAIDAEVETRGNFNSIAEDATSFYMVGESLNGDWPRYHTRADMVHGQVNSDLYYAINDALFTGGKNMSDFAGSAIYQDTAYLSTVSGKQGGYSGAIMGNFFGNHDVLRALDRAGGDYAKLRLAQTFLFTSPGNVPMLYQGDDIGTPQGSGQMDPGNRLKMKFKEIDGLTADEEATLEHVKKVGLLREAHAPLRRGTRTTEQVDNDFWVYKVSYQGEDVYVALNRGGNQSYTPPSAYSDALGNCSAGNVPSATSCIFVK